MNNNVFTIDGKSPCRCERGPGVIRNCAKLHNKEVAEGLLTEYHQFCRVETGYDEWPEQNKVLQTAGANTERREQMRRSYVDRRKNPEPRDTTRIDWGTVWVFALIIGLLITVVWVAASGGN